MYKQKGSDKFVVLRSCTENVYDAFVTYIDADDERAIHDNIARWSTDDNFASPHFWSNLSQYASSKGKPNFAELFSAIENQNNLQFIKDSLRRASSTYRTRVMTGLKLQPDSPLSAASKPTPLVGASKLLKEISINLHTVASQDDPPAFILVLTAALLQKVKVTQNKKPLQAADLEQLYTELKEVTHQYQETHADSSHLTRINEIVDSAFQRLGFTHHSTSRSSCGL